MITKSEKVKEKRIYGSFSIPKKYIYLTKAPFKISDRCCYFLKKKPSLDYEKQTGRLPMLGILNNESNMRSTITNCNVYEQKRPQSRPLLKWTSFDIWHYIKINKLKYCSLYDLGWKRTGCMFCLFGIFSEKGINKFQRMYKTHPKQLNYFLNKLNGREVLDYLKVPYSNYKENPSFFTNKEMLKYER